MVFKCVTLYDIGGIINLSCAFFWNIDLGTIRIGCPRYIRVGSFLTVPDIRGGRDLGIGVAGCGGLSQSRKVGKSTQRSKECRFWHMQFMNGGFQLLDLIIPELKSHVIPYKFKFSHWLKLQHSDWRANLVKDFFLQMNFPPMRALEFIRDHMTFKLRYNQI